jgi:RNA ligase
MITKKIADKLVQEYETFYCKELEINNCKVYIYNYLIQDYEAFKAESHLGQELRGLTFVKDSANTNIKTFLSIPKFFNINEISENQEQRLSNLSIKKISEKLDGSLIQPILIQGEIFMKTKQSFENPQAQMAQKLIESNCDLKFFILDLFDQDFQPLFELVSPDNKIVLDYKETELKLIAVRDLNGHFIDIDKFDYPLKAQTFDQQTKSLQELIEDCQTKEDLEGYVVKFIDSSCPTNERLVKLKSLWYLERHRLVSDADRISEVFKFILNDKLDDILSTVSEMKREELLKVQHKVAVYVSKTCNEIQEILIKVKDRDRKSIAQDYISHPYFSIIMSCVKKMICDLESIEETLKEYLLKKYNKEQKVKEFIEEISDV